MNYLEAVFGRRPGARRALAVFDPAAVSEWREIRVQEGAEPVQARLAARNGVLKTDYGPMRYRAGEHYLLEGERNNSVVRRDIFERTYRRREDGLYSKRTDIVYRRVILDEPVFVRTLEGLERGDADDWIVQGVVGEVWPVSAERARTLYVPV
jgi:hypothetical protein